MILDVYAVYVNSLIMPKYFPLIKQHQKLRDTILATSVDTTESGMLSPIPAKAE